MEPPPIKKRTYNVKILLIFMLKSTFIIYAVTNSWDRLNNLHVEYCCKWRYIFCFCFFLKNILILKKDTHFAVWLHTSFLLNKHTVRVSWYSWIFETFISIIQGAQSRLYETIVLLKCFFRPNWTLLHYGFIVIYLMFYTAISLTKHMSLFFFFQVEYAGSPK